MFEAKRRLRYEGSLGCEIEMGVRKISAANDTFEPERFCSR
jgi:hypothetical protein